MWGTRCLQTADSFASVEVTMRKGRWHPHLKRQMWGIQPILFVEAPDNP
jgi:hypothetical protein